MNSLDDYGSDSCSESETTLKKQKTNPIPNIEPEIASNHLFKNTEITLNAPLIHIQKPTVGPLNPYSSANATNKNTLAGFFESHSMDDASFTTLQRTYQRDGYTLNPDGSGYIGDLFKAEANNGRVITEKNAAYVKPKRLPKGDPSSVDFLGPWAGYENEKIGLDPKQTEKQDEEIHVPIEAVVPSEKDAQEIVASKSVFHGQSQYDYLGRTYMHVPTDLDIDLNKEIGDQECFVPKKCIHTWTGHTKAVNAIRFFPKHGHLLLSCSLDNSIRLWDVYHDRKCLRTFQGHNKSVKDITFSHDGKLFLSASYDKWIKLWNTETGQCISSFTTTKLPHVLKFNPLDSNVFLVGCQDRKVYQFDIRTGNIEMEYAQHIGPVNTITFLDENRRFITTSDDKSIRAWEYGSGVIVKYIAEPDMHSMPAVSLSWSQKWLACTALDNQIAIFSTTDKFRNIRSKSFRGHLVAGYACQPSWSPDDRFISSGDSEGTLWFWDFKSTKVLKKLKAHTDVVIGTEWNPQETSKVASCSWDGTIKYWD